jgi:predicted RNase H-like HicB family nuclease
MFMDDSYASWKENLLTVVFTPVENGGYVATIEEFPELTVQGTSFTDVKEKLGILLNNKIPGRALYGIRPMDGFKYKIKVMAHSI